MKKLFLTSLLSLFLFGACATKPKQHVSAPSTAGVKNKISEAQTSVVGARAASERSSVHIGKFKTKAELIDFKATRALELL